MCLSENLSVGKCSCRKIWCRKICVGKFGVGKFAVGKTSGYPILAVYVNLVRIYKPMSLSVTKG